MRPPPLLLLSALSACALNPAFDPIVTSEEVTSEEVASTGPDTPTSGGETTGPDPQSTGTTLAGADTTGIAETTAPLTGTTTSTADDSTGSDDSTGASTDPDACWDLPPASWQAKLTVLEKFEDLAPHDPWIAPDGLSLLYIANDDYRPFRTTRASRLDPFLNGAPITLWGPNPPYPGYPRLSQDSQELLTSHDGDLYFSAFKLGDPNDQYTVPALLPGPVNSGKPEEILTITADGATLIVQRDETMPMQPFPFKRRFHQFARVDPQPGAAFMDGQDVTPYIGPHGFALCPTLSPDGLRLLFASTDSIDFTETNIADVVQIFSTTRATLASGWDPPVRLDAIPPGGGVLCPTSITADGCALTYVKFEYGGATSLPYTMYLLERSP